VHFGLGSATSIDELKISWPDKHTTTLRDVEADQILTVFRESLE
jgi:hypothetical protein